MGARLLALLTVTTAAASCCCCCRAELLWSETATWDGCNGKGAPKKQLYTGEALDLGGGSVLLVGRGAEGTGTYYRVDAATGEVSYALAQPLRGICAAMTKQSNHTIIDCDVMTEGWVGVDGGSGGTTWVGAGSIVMMGRTSQQPGVGLFGVNAATGKLKWSRVLSNCTGAMNDNDLEAGHRVALAPGSSGLLMVACGGHGGVSSALDPATGEPVWSVPNRQLLPPATSGCPPQCLSYCGKSLPCTECCCPSYNPYGPDPTKECKGHVDFGVCGAAAAGGGGCGAKLPVNCQHCNSSGTESPVFSSPSFVSP
jgi:hypothetical protein